MPLIEPAMATEPAGVRVRGAASRSTRGSDGRSPGRRPGANPQNSTCSSADAWRATTSEAVRADATQPHRVRARRGNRNGCSRPLLGGRRRETSPSRSRRDAPGHKQRIELHRGDARPAPPRSSRRRVVAEDASSADESSSSKLDEQRGAAEGQSRAREATVAPRPPRRATNRRGDRHRTRRVAVAADALGAERDRTAVGGRDLPATAIETACAAASAGSVINDPGSLRGWREPSAR